MDERTFEELISRIANNKRDALDEFYQHFGKIIFGVAFSVCKRKSETDEVVNEVLIKVWNSAKDLHNIEKLEAWIYRVTFNFAINKIKNRQDFEIIQDKPIAEEGYDKVIDKITFYDLISHLSEIEQQILCYKFIEDLTFAEIAEVIGKPPDTIAYEYYSALKKLKTHLDEFM